MTTSYTPILKLALPVTGELVGTWGDIVNNSITSMVEEAVAGLATINVWAGSPPTNTLTVVDGAASTSRCAILECSGTPGAAAFVVCPAQTKFYIISNSVVGGYDVTLTTPAGTGIAVPNGKAMLLYCDGTNVVNGVDYVDTARQLKSNTSTGVAQITGPAAGSTRTYTLPDADATILTTNDVVTVPQGGTGRTSLTANNLVAGNGTSAVNLIAPGAVGEILVSTGTAWNAGPISAAAVISFSGGTTGFTPSSPTPGTVVLGGTLGAANGGTGLTSPGAAANVLQSTGTGWVSAFFAKGFSNMAVFTSSGNWTAPAGVNNIRVTVIGGGGGGGSGFSSGAAAGASGGTSSAFSVSASGGTGGFLSAGSGGSASGGNVNINGLQGAFSFYPYSPGSAGANGLSGAAGILGFYGSGGRGGSMRSSSSPPGALYFGSGGGGGGAIAYKTVTPGTSYTITVGSGGSGASGDTPGLAGGDGIVIIEY